MEYEDQDDPGESGSGPGYNDSLGNSYSTRPPTKLPSPVGEAAGTPPPPLRRHRYKECLKNHAVGMGGHAVDGCGEFLPAGEDGTLESLRCAACNCHRNFHRKENEGAAAAVGGGGAFPIHQYPHHQQMFLTHHPHGHFGYRGPSGYLQVAPPRAAAPPLALPSSSGGGAGSGSRDEMDEYYSNPSSSGGGGGAAAKKRARTKFTAEQKEKMLNLAERLEWRIQKQDEEMVQQFCGEMGIKRHVLKVWMHNNKVTLGKKT